MARVGNRSRRERKYTKGQSTKRPGTGKLRSQARMIRAMRWLGVRYPV